jgi:hypothetical protein
MTDRARQHRQHVRELVAMFHAAHQLLDDAGYPAAGPREPWETWRTRSTNTTTTEGPNV